MKTLKLLFASFLMVLTLQVSAQEQKFIMDTTEVINSNHSKVILYSNALSFFANTFKSSNDVIQMKDDEYGKVIGKGYLSERRRVTITITVKDSLYKYEIISDELDIIEVDLNINNCGIMKGKTYLPVKIKNGKPIFDLRNIYFKWTEPIEGEWVITYDGFEKIKGVSKRAINDWIYKVDRSISINPDGSINNNYKNKELENLLTPIDYELLFIIKNLKYEMNKSIW